MNGTPTAYAAPTPQTAQNKAYIRNVQAWSVTTPKPSASASTSRPTRARSTRNAGSVTPAPATPVQMAAPTLSASYGQPMYPQAYHATPVAMQQPMPVPAQPLGPQNPPKAVLPTTPQALHTTYPSRMKTGVSLLMQPVFTSTTAALLSGTGRPSRRGGAVINYADPGSGDDAGALDSEDSDFQGRASRQRGAGTSSAMGVFNSTTGAGRSYGSPAPPAAPTAPERAGLDQSYLGMLPPARFITAKAVPMSLAGPTNHDFPPPDSVVAQAEKRNSLVPIRVEFETDTHRIRDCFAWNINEELIRPEAFARIFCNDLDLPVVPWAETIANQIRAQLEDYQDVAAMELGMDGAVGLDENKRAGEELPECRVILSIDVQIANHHLLDHIEWDLLSPLTPEEFSRKLCSELGLTGEAVPLIAHAVHEELIKHKRDAIEWGVIGGAPDANESAPAVGDQSDKRDRSGYSLFKDKTGLGLGWGRAPRDGRGPKVLRSVWRDWQDAEEFSTSFDLLTTEDLEKREVERERASRRLRRETSKFQSNASGRMRNLRYR
ncbi:hypothetical protein BKA70DRAFT_1370206 [Coprinopsis sp. MPI-PUGE-AT-0042]|nr:hypothetical protein BKA70DRAFT_1370206 [Coprinopsis sp. MPI-PUGE-AT-0042]